MQRGAAIATMAPQTLRYLPCSFMQVWCPARSAGFIDVWL